MFPLADSGTHRRLDAFGSPAASIIEHFCDTAVAVHEQALADDGDLAAAHHRDVAPGAAGVRRITANDEPVNWFLGDRQYAVRPDLPQNGNFFSLDVLEWRTMRNHVLGTSNGGGATGCAPWERPDHLVDHTICQVIRGEEEAAAGARLPYHRNSVILTHAMYLLSEGERNHLAEGFRPWDQARCGAAACSVQAQEAALLTPPRFDQAPLHRRRTLYLQRAWDAEIGVHALGEHEVGQLVNGTLQSVPLTMQTTFGDYAQVMLEYCGSRHDEDDERCLAVRNALAATGLLPYGDGDRDGDGILDRKDNCVNTPNDDQTPSAPGSPLGKACDDDVAHDPPEPGVFGDGVCNVAAGCRLPEPERGAFGFVVLPDGIVNPNLGSFWVTASLAEIAGEHLLWDGDGHFYPLPDGTRFLVDNCPDALNPLQENVSLQHELAGGLGLEAVRGDACELADPDRDGWSYALDNCDDVFNPDQADGDGDGVGDVCDSCPETANQRQHDCDGDGEGDACEGPGYRCVEVRPTEPPPVVREEEAGAFRWRSTHVRVGQAAHLDVRVYGDRWDYRGEYNVSYCYCGVGVDEVACQRQCEHQENVYLRNLDPWQSVTWAKDFGLEEWGDIDSADVQERCSPGRLNVNTRWDEANNLLREFCPNHDDYVAASDGRTTELVWDWRRELEPRQALAEAGGAPLPDEVPVECGCGADPPEHAFVMASSRVHTDLDHDSPDDEHIPDVRKEPLFTQPVALRAFGEDSDVLPSGWAWDIPPHWMWEIIPNHEMWAWTETLRLIQGGAVTLLDLSRPCWYDDCPEPRYLGMLAHDIERALGRLCWSDGCDPRVADLLFGAAEPIKEWTFSVPAPAPDEVDLDFSGMAAASVPYEDGIRVVVAGGQRRSVFNDHLFYQDVKAAGATGWTEVQGVGLSDGPGPRSYMAMAGAPDGTVYLFGGQSASGWHDDLWVLHPTGFDLYPATTAGAGPGGRAEHLLVADPDGERLWLLGGSGPDAPYGDLWAFDLGGNQWKQVLGKDRPVWELQRRGGCVALDPRRQKLFWYGGLRGLRGREQPTAELLAVDLDAGTVQTMHAGCGRDGCPLPAASCDLRRDPDGKLVLLGADGWLNEVPVAWVRHPVRGDWHVRPLEQVERYSKLAETSTCADEHDETRQPGVPCDEDLPWWSEPGVWECSGDKLWCRRPEGYPVGKGRLLTKWPYTAAALQGSVLWTQTDRSLGATDLAHGGSKWTRYHPDVELTTSEVPVDVVAVAGGAVSVTVAGVALVRYGSLGIEELDTGSLLGARRAAASPDAVHVATDGAEVVSWWAGGETLVAAARTPLPGPAVDLATDESGRLVVLTAEALRLYAAPMTGTADEPLVLLSEVPLEAGLRRVVVDGRTVDVLALVSGERYEATESGALVHQGAHRLHETRARVERSGRYAALRTPSRVQWVELP